MQQPPFLRCLIHADNVAARPHHLVRFSVMEKADVAIRKRRVAADAAGDFHNAVDEGEDGVAHARRFAQERFP